jgi:hypothetical protein
MSRWASRRFILSMAACRWPLRAISASSLSMVACSVPATTSVCCCALVSFASHAAASSPCTAANFQLPHWKKFCVPDRDCIIASHLDSPPREQALLVRGSDKHTGGGATNSQEIGLMQQDNNEHDARPVVLRPARTHRHLPFLL